MDMWRLNKIALVFLVLISCNNHPKKTDSCNSKRILNYVLFKGFEKINKVTIQQLKNKTNNIYFSNNIVVHDNKTLRLKINQYTSKILENNCKLIVNDSLFYTITDIKFKKIERFGMWGSVGYFCYLDQYKLNNSLIKDQQSIVIFKKTAKKYKLKSQ